MPPTFGLPQLGIAPFGPPKPQRSANPLDNLTPEQLAEMFEPFAQEQQGIDQQMAYARALGGQQAPRHSTAIGGALGAVAQGINGLNSGLQQHQATTAQDALLKRKGAADAQKFRLMQALEAQKTEREQAFKRETIEAEAKRRAAAAAQAEKTWRTHNSITSGQADKRAAVMAGQKTDQKRQEGMVPGLEFEEGAIPTADDAKKMKASMASANRLNSYVDEVTKLHSEHGTELTGPAAARMGQLMTAIRLESKNIAELGALSGPDMDLMNTLTGSDPSSFGANLKAMFGSDNTAVALDGLKRWTNDTLDANKKAFGYRDAQKPATANGIQLDEGDTDDEAAYQAWKKANGF